MTISTEEALFFLGKRVAVPFHIGSSRDAQLLRKPIYRNYPLSKKYEDYLNSESSRPLHYGKIGNFNDKNVKFGHKKTRNCFSYTEPFLFEACNSNIRILSDVLNQNSWQKVTPTISTRSFCTGISVNHTSTFGFARTYEAPLIFSVDYTQDVRFREVSFIQTDDKISGFQTSSFIEGETLMLFDSGKMVLKDKELDSFEIMFEPEEIWGLSSVLFASHPRVSMVSLNNYIGLVDLRAPNPQGSMIRSKVKKASSLLSIDFYRVVASGEEGLSIIDNRFPEAIDFMIPFTFDSPAVTLENHYIDQFNCVFATCSESSDVILFPLNSIQYSEPVRPFDISMKEYESMDQLSIIGSFFHNNHAILMFENLSVISIALERESSSCRHYFCEFNREERESEKDVFTFSPYFAPLNMNNEDSRDIKYHPAFPEIQNMPPSSFLKPSEPEIDNEDIGEGYIINVEEALSLNDESVNEIMHLYWKNHLDMIRANL